MSTVRKSVISNCEKKFLLKNLSEFSRLDGRAFDEFRSLDIKFGKDWGCCYVSLGKTRVLAQVSCEVQLPKSSRPSEGILNINIELNPIAAPYFEPGRQSDLSVQLNRLLEKCLKDSRAVDLESLCIKANEKVWTIRVDVNVLNHEGNILDCASVAALAALAHFRRPDVTCDGEEFIIHSYKQRDPIPMVIHHYPVCVTFSVFSSVEVILADPTLLEEEVADAFLSVGINAYKELCGLHLGGKADLAPHLILATSSKAATRAGVVVQQIKDAIEEDTKLRLERLEQGFHETLNLEELDKSLDELRETLDPWAGKTKKHKKKRKEKAKEEEQTLTADIENLGAGTAALVPTENEGQSKVWEASDTDEENDDDEVVYVELPKPKIDTVAILDSDSEEEAVVILNADQKTNKRKKKLKT